MPASGSDVNDRVVRALSHFGVRLLRELIKPPGSANVFLSPLSVAAVLTMAHNGASGQTRAAIAKALGLDKIGQSVIDDTYASLMKFLTTPDPLLDLYVANSIWVKAGIPLKPEYVERTQALYQAEIAVAHADPDFAAVQAINAWANRGTHGKIAKIIQRAGELGPLTLFNAVYFKGTWSKPFERRNTESGPFTLANRQEKACPMMHLWSEFNYYQDDNVQAIRLPYRGGRISTYVFVPDPDLGLAGFLERLDFEEWSSWLNVLSPSERGPQSVHLQLPRFKVETDARLDNALKSLGMDAAFDPERAEFGEMCLSYPQKVYIGLVRHKAILDVGEEGAHAGASTPATLRLAGLSPVHIPDVIVDSPFFLATRDDQTGALLFVGAIVDP